MWKTISFLMIWKFSVTSFMIRKVCYNIKDGLKTENFLSQNKNTEYYVPEFQLGKIEMKDEK